MKPLKILLGNNTLSLLAGSETWVKTLALQLKKLGHSVHGFSPELGIIARQLEEKGVSCFDQLPTSGVKPFSFLLEDTSQHEYDIIISNHHQVVSFLRKLFPKTPIISTIHGIIHKMDNGRGQEVNAPEHPALEAGVNQFVAVSEEVSDILRKDYGLDSMIIRNFFDTEKYDAKRPVNEKPQVFFINTNYALPNDPEIAVLREVVKHYGAKLIAAGQNFGITDDVTKALEDADVVLGMGRSVLEGVCAGRLGIVHGRWGTGGVIAEDTVGEIRKQNFSGRNSHGKIWTKEQFIEAIDRYYNPATISWGREYVRSQHNVVHAADMFIQLSRSLIGAQEAGVTEAPMKKLKFTLYDRK